MKNYRKLSFDEVMQHYHFSKNTLNLLIRKNDIPYKITANGKYVFQQQELRYWQSHRVIGGSKFEKENIAKEARKVNVSLKKISLTSFLSPQTIFMDMQANSPTSVFRKCAKYAYEQGLIDDEKIFLEELIKREESSSTSLGEGVALPHTSNHDEFLILQSFIFIVLVQRPIPFQADDGQLVDLLILPAMNDDSLHSYVIAKIGSLLYMTDFAKQLRQLHTSDEVMALIKGYENQLIKKHFKEKL